jgi:hypothetical protein
MQNKKISLYGTIKLIIISAACWIMSLAPAYAAAEVTLTVKNPDPYTGNQSWFVFTRNPGESIDDVVTVKNFGDETATVSIYPVDATTSQSGSFILKFDHEDQDGIGEWTTVSSKSIQVKAGERVDVPFTIKVPKELSPGQYIGGIVIEYGAEAAAQKTTEAVAACTLPSCEQSVVSVKTRIGSRIYLSVPGKARELVDLLDFKYFTSLSGQPRFKFTIENSGNVTYVPQAEITIRDASGKIYDSFTKPLGSSLPGTVIEPVVDWEKQTPLIASFTATAKVTFPKRFAIAGEPMHGAAVTKSVRFSIIPWSHIFYFTVFAVFAALLCWLHTMRVRKALANSESYAVGADDDLMSLAQKLNISWKTIARLNKMKPPYTLRKGTRILVPKHKKNT